MKMTQIINKLHTVLEAASSTLLADALVYKYDFETTADDDSTVWEIRLIPMPNNEDAEYMDAGGWRASFTILIEARRPSSNNTAAELEANCVMCEELLQVLADNREMTIAGESEAASMVGELAARNKLKWDYGSSSEGETSYTVTMVTPTWEGPQIAETA